MAKQTPRPPNGRVEHPAAAASPQIILTLVNGQVQLGSNIAPGPHTWLAIAQVCSQGVGIALAQMAQGQSQEEAPRIVVPTLQVKGGPH